MTQFAAGLLHKFNPAESVHFQSDSRQVQRFGLQSFHSGQPCPARQPGTGKQHCIEDVREPRHTGGPAKVTDHKIKQECAHLRSGSASALRRMSSMTRRCTELKTWCVHKSKYQRGRTCNVYQVLPNSVVVPSALGCK